jgi:hypothetical protein
LNNGGAELVLKNYCYFVFHCSYNIYRVKSFPFTHHFIVRCCVSSSFPPSRLGVEGVFFCRSRQIFSCGLIALALTPATPLARFSLQTRCCLCVKLCAMDDISPAYRHPKARIVRPPQKSSSSSPFHFFKYPFSFEYFALAKLLTINQIHP